MPNFLDEQQVEKLANHLLIHITPTIENAIDKKIETKVNGKIKEISEKLDGYIVIDVDWKAKDAEWKEQMKPVKELYDGSTNFFNGSKKIFAWIAAFGAAVGAIIFIKDKI